MTTDRSPARVSPPNIIYVLADDLGYGDLACLNDQSLVPTPHLDQLAERGMVFSDAHATSSVCTPSRYSILTGRYNWRSRLQAGVLRQWDGPLIEPGDVTVAGFLKEHGYDTACIGKWHLGWDWPTFDGRPTEESLPYAVVSTPVERLRDEFWQRIDFSRPVGGGPVDRGFDSYFGVDVPNFPPYAWFVDDRLSELPTTAKPDHLYGNPGPAVRGWSHEAMLPAFTERAVEFIADHAPGPGQTSRPFFLFLPLTAPHSPVTPSPQQAGRSGIGAYGDLICEIDAMIGTVLAALDHAGLTDNTMVVFTSDNGPELETTDDEGAYERAHRVQHYSMGQLRGVKRDSWDGGHRVPLIIAWPAVVPAGARCSQLVSLVDLMATCAAMVETPLTPGAGEDSVSMLPLLSGQDTPIRDHLVTHSCDGVFSVRAGQWVLIDAPTGAENPEPDWFRSERGYVDHPFPLELYDLGADLAERVNQGNDHPGRVAELRQLLRATRSRPGAAGPLHPSESSQGGP